MVRQLASVGYLRKHLPQKFSGELAVESVSPSADGASPVAERAAKETSSLGAMVLDKVAEAKMKGFEGDACGECGNFTLVRNGACLKCNTCGATSGCS